MEESQLVTGLEKKEYYKNYYLTNKDKYKSQKKFKYVITIGEETYTFDKKSDIINLITKQQL